MQMSLAGYIGLQKAETPLQWEHIRFSFVKYCIITETTIHLTFHGNNQSQYLKSPACAHQNQ